MANRDRDYQTGNYQPRGGRDRNDEGRYSNADDRRDYGPYTENDEGDSSVRAGSYDQGRVQYSQHGRYGSRDRYGSQESNERSSGRYAGYGDFGQGDYSGGREGYSGQDRYGQGGFSRSQGAGGGEFRGGNYGGGNYGGGYGGGFGRGDYGGGAYGGANRSGGSYGGGVGAAGNDLNYGAGTGRGFSGYGYEGSASREQSSFGSQNYGGQTGQHRGKGPKGYQRTDERLKELICERLRDDPEIDPSEVTITVQGGKVTLEGMVESRHAKNAIEDVAEQFGVQEVQNNLRVQRASFGPDSSRSTIGRAGSEDNDRSQRQNKH